MFKDLLFRMKFEAGLSNVTKMYSNTLQEHTENPTKKFVEITNPFYQPRDSRAFFAASCSASCFDLPLPSAINSAPTKTPTVNCLS